MRVALLTYSSKPRGGVVHTLHLAEALARAGAEVTVFSLGRGGDDTFFRPVGPAVTVKMVPFHAIADEDVGDRILRSIDVLGDAFARAGSYDIVHAQDCISANAVGRCVRTIHHLDTFTTPELAACHEKAVTEPYARICVSAAVAEEVRQGWGLEPTVIANGVESARFIAAAASGLPQWRDALGSFVLAVGGIEPRKGSIDLLEAFALLDRPDLSLVFAGGETLFDYRDYRRRFDARAVELGIDAIVLGTVDNEDLPHLVSQASVLPFLSTKEGFGLAAMEALAAGTPVVARDLPVLREVFGTTVTYASEHASMARGMADAIDNGHDASAGRALARSLTWDAAARRHLEFYRSLL